MNDLGNIDFSSNDPFKSRREFIKKKGGRPKTEWEDYIEEIEASHSIIGVPNPRDGQEHCEMLILYLVGT